MMLIVSTTVGAGVASASDYEVQPGDSLWTIAANHDMTVDELRDMNDLDQTLLRVGDVLRVKGPAYDGATIDHTVVAGEALSVIAEDHGVEVEAILDLNGLSDADHIRVGDVLQIPVAEASPSGPNAVEAVTIRHVVKPGEVVGAIAEQYGVTTASVLRSNEISNPNLIRIGQVIEIPDVAPRDETERLTAVFAHWAEANDISPDLVMAVAWQESRWREGALSSAGAIGIGQLMPGTAHFVSEYLIGVPGLDPWNPDENIRMTARYVSYLLDETDGDLELALASYYQGIGSVRSRGPFAETDAYVASVLSYVQGFESEDLPGLRGPR